MISHSHLCKHCDTTWNCQCIDNNDYDVRTKHGCPEAIRYAKKIRWVINHKDDSPYLSRK